MVFKPFSHLARQSFTKSLTHGYAQSVVAASQSSHPFTTTPQFGTFSGHPANRFGKSGTAQLRDSFQNNSVSNNDYTNVKGGATNTGNETSSDSGLADYYAAWQKHQHSPEGNEWQQFQFVKRIGWKPSTVGKGKEEKEVALRQETTTLQGLQASDRAYTTSTVEDVKKVEQDAAEVAALAKVDEAIAQEIKEIRQLSEATPEAGREATIGEGAAKQLSESSSVTVRSATPAVSPASDNTAVNSPTTQDATPYVDHLSYLRNAERYAEIPPVFESMLRAGVLPSANAYDALLEAAIHLPTDAHLVVPKVLDVYSDMLRRKVLPTTETYSILLDLLSLRALEVAQMRSDLVVDKLRFGGLKKPGHFMFRSQEAEHDILAEDDALSIAIKLFASSTATSQHRAYSASTYRLLLNACAAYGEVDHMIRVYSHMEAHKVVPFASVYPPMIKAFAVSGDLRSAVECYNEYKSLAIADDNGVPAILTREDDEVYAAVVKAYAICNKHDGAERFFDKIVKSIKGPEDQNDRVSAIQDAVVVKALVQARLDSGDFNGALKFAEEQSMSATKRAQAMTLICATAADNNNVDVATNAYHQSVPSNKDGWTAAIAMLAMHIRHGEVEAARSIWSTMSAESAPTASFIEPTAMYAVALVGSGSVDEGLMQARQSFGRIRSGLNVAVTSSETTSQIDEAIEFIGSYLIDNGVVPSPQASMSFMWAMIENGGLVPQVAEQLLAGLGPSDIAILSSQDLKLALQVEAGIVINGQPTRDVAHSARFAHLLETSLASRIPLDERTCELVERSLAKVEPQRPDLVAQWQASRLPATQPLTFVAPQLSPPVAIPTVYSETFDPYASMIDHRGSAIIVEELEKQGPKSGASLNEALMRFRNIRRAGRHPRYIAYAKLIAAAAKDGRANLTHDILGMARQDMPFLPQYPVVRHGWASILDAMVGASLTAGNRRLAENYHQELLEIGAAPTANTFGLYITTLKESTKTFDEATEAVKIFHRAKSEGVEPSSFLYNALIGKLGKARRIDDCLFYFAEMRTRGIRPTSVTYGTIVNALCRVSDERFAQELFDEMELMPNYKPRPAPYNSLMQFFLTTKRDSAKVLEYYQRMQSRNIQPTMHTYKLLIDTHATLEPINMAAAEAVLDAIRASGQQPEAVHYASLIHAKGCALHDMAGARQIFDNVISNATIRPQACLYQALFESMVANHCVEDTGAVLNAMAAAGVAMTPYIANTLIHGWAMRKDIVQAKIIYEGIGKERREPSTYEAMTRAFLAVEDRENASAVVQEMHSRGYPSAVSGKIFELLGHGMARASSVVPAARSAEVSL
ncbi:hypothetical protein MMC19_003361 [Ptychographa xylographoides]|nr:hypothetical protein [Ptychographa xylographoides]